MPATPFTPFNPFNRPIAFGFHFRNWKSTYTVYAYNFGEALTEVTRYLSYYNFDASYGDIDLFINGQPASESTPHVAAA